jgi:hypothetical protein
VGDAELHMGAAYEPIGINGAFPISSHMVRRVLTKLPSKSENRFLVLGSFA